MQKDFKLLRYEFFWFLWRKYLWTFHCQTILTTFITYCDFRIGPWTCPSLASYTVRIIQLPDLYFTFLSGKFPSACSVCRTADSITRTECLTPFLKHGNLTQISVMLIAIFVLPLFLIYVTKRRQTFTVFLLRRNYFFFFLQSKWWINNKMICVRINVTTHHSDFKELVPEFYMPENKVSELLPSMFFVIRRNFFSISFELKNTSSFR